MKRNPKEPGNLHLFGEPVQLQMLQEFTDMAAGVIAEAEAEYKRQQASRPLAGQLALKENAS